MHRNDQTESRKSITIHARYLRVGVTAGRGVKSGEVQISRKGAIRNARLRSRHGLEAGSCFLTWRERLVNHDVKLFNIEVKSLQSPTQKS